MRLLQEIWNHPANQGSRVSALIDAIRWQCFKRITQQHMDIPFHGLKLRCHPNSHSASRAIYFSGLPDYWEMRFILDYLRPGDQFIDVGANIGLYTLLALSVVRQAGHVHSFEPNHEIAARLRESLELNNISNCSVHGLAAANARGFAPFVPTGDDCTSHINPGDAKQKMTHEVNTIRLEEFLPDAQYAMAKFDIEGYEPLALRGARTLLNRGNPPVLQIEMAGYSNRYGITTSDFIAELNQLDYFTAVYLPESRTLEATDRPWEVPVDNVLAIHQGRKSFVLDRIDKSSFQ